jgi:hypothetical protein
MIKLLFSRGITFSCEGKLIQAGKHRRSGNVNVPIGKPMVNNPGFAPLPTSSETNYSRGNASGMPLNIMSVEISQTDTGREK